MATIGTKQIALVGHGLSVGSHPARGEGAAGDIYKEAAAQSYLDGGIVVSSSGKLAAAAGNTQVAVGQAVRAATGVTDTPVSLVMLQPGMLIEANLFKAAGANHTLAITDLFAAYALQVNAGIYSLNQAETGATNIFARIMDVHIDSAIGDVNARVIAQVLYSAWNSA